MAWLPIVLEVAKVVVPLVAGALGMHVHHKRRAKRAPVAGPNPPGASQR